MPQPLPDLPLPPALACDEPLSEAVLARLDAAFATAADDGVPAAELPALVQVDPHAAPEGSYPPAAHLVPDEARRWAITDDSAAQWAMAHVATIDDHLERDAAQRDDWQARIDHWFQQASTTALRRRSFFQAHLIAYATDRRAADPKASKTLNLPSGRVTSSDRAAVVKVTDDDALAGWLSAHDLTVGPDGADLVVVTAKVYAVPLRKVLVPDGDKIVVAATGEVLTELPPGLEVEPKHTTYDVRTS